MARGISTVIGTLLFLIAASLLLALALRAFSETMLAFDEITNNQRISVEQLEISVNYTQWKKTLAQEVISSIKVISGTSTSTSPMLLDYPDGNAIVIESTRVETVSSVLYASGPTELITNGEFNYDLQNWTTGGCSWSVVSIGGDRKARCICSVTGTSSGSAFILQQFNLGFTAESSILSFEYEASVDKLDAALVYLLVVQIRRGNTVVWYWVVDLLATRGARQTLTLSPLCALRYPDTYVLNFSLILAWKGASTFTFTLDKVSLTASPQPPPQPPQQPYIVYNLAIIDISTTNAVRRFRGWLSVSSNLSQHEMLYIEVYRWERDGTILIEKSAISSGKTFYMGGFEGIGGTSFLLIAYSSKPFKLVLDHFNASVLALSSARVKVSNVGYEPVEVIAVWLRSLSWEKRVDVKRTLPPGDSIELVFDTSLEWDRCYEVRVVTAMRVHVAKITTSSG